VTDDTTTPRRSAIETSATIEGRKPVTMRAIAATAMAAASPGAIDRDRLAIVAGLVRTARASA
jgi:hypothetical protein